MRHLLHGLLFFLFLANPAVAQISDPYTSITKDELRKAIYAGEVREVETAFRAAQAKFLRGEANIDDLRWLNEVFTTTHPDVISFTEAWLRRYPKFTLRAYGSGLDKLQNRLDHSRREICP